MATPGYEGQTDRELAIGAANRDQRSFAALYDRYFDSLYDFAIRTVRNTGHAADVVQQTFEAARDSLGRGDVPPNVKVWLFTLARGAATAEPAQRSTAQTAGVPVALPSFVDPDPRRTAERQEVAQDAELREAVWASASALGPREYSLLDMSVRRELDPGEIAAGLGMRPEGAQQALADLRGSLERTATATLLVRRGGAGCPDLAALLARSTAPETSLELRNAVEQHLATCARCQATAAQTPSAAEVLAALAPVAPAAGLKEIVWGNVAMAGVAPVAAAPVHKERRTRWLLWIGLAILGLLLIAALVAALLASGDGDGPKDPDDVRSTSHEPGEPSTDNVVRMVWSRQDGVIAYSVTWSEEKFEQPDEEGDLSGDATDATSPELDPGDWYFHLRTQAEDGQWTSTVHVGPFEIEAEATPTAEPESEETETPEPEPTASPLPTQPPASPSPQPTATVTAAASPTP